MMNKKDEGREVWAVKNGRATLLVIKEEDNGTGHRVYHWSKAGYLSNWHETVGRAFDSYDEATKFVESRGYMLRYEDCEWVNRTWVRRCM